MTSIAAWNSTEGLPKQFIASMKILFDILDEKGCGYVHLDDIETRWHEEGVKGLPGGVTEALRKVTPSDGFLSFDRFVAGLKLALLTSKKEKLHSEGKINNHLSSEKAKESRKADSETSGKTIRNSEKSDNDPRTNQRRIQNETSGNNRSQSANTAAVKPNNVHGNSHHNNRTLQRSRPVQESKGRKEEEDKNHERKKIYDQYFKKLHSEGKSERENNTNQRPVVPAKPDDVVQTNSSGQVPPKVPPRDKSKRIITELKNWQRRVNGEVQYNSAKDRLTTTSSDSRLDKHEHKQGNDIYGKY